MNYKTLILIFLSLAHWPALHAIEVWDYIRPVLPFFVATWSYFKIITDYFVPATQADLEQAKKEILTAITDRTEEMQQTTYKNLDQFFNENKKELEEKIDQNIEIVTRRSQLLRKCLEDAKAESSKKIKRNHSNLSIALRKKIALHTQTNKKQIDSFLREVAEYNALAQKKLLIELLALQQKLEKIKKKNKMAYRQTQELVKKNNEQQIENLTQNNSKISDDTEKLQQSFMSNQEKIDQFYQKFVQIKKNNQELSQTIQQIFKRIIAINQQHKDVSKKTSPNHAKKNPPIIPGTAVFAFLHNNQQV